MAIELKNLSKSYHGQKVVNDVSLLLPKDSLLLLSGQMGQAKVLCYQ